MQDCENTDMRKRTYGEDIENMFTPTGLGTNPIWFEGQTVFQLNPELITWKNSMYRRTATLFQNTVVVEENREKFIEKLPNLSKERWIRNLKIAGVTIAIYTPILIGLLYLLK